MSNKLRKFIIAWAFSLMSSFAFANNGTMILSINNTTQTTCTLLENAQPMITGSGQLAAGSIIPASINPQSTVSFTVEQSSWNPTKSTVYLSYVCNKHVVAFITYHYKWPSAYLVSELVAYDDNTTATPTIVEGDKSSPARITWKISST